MKTSMKLVTTFLLLVLLLVPVSSAQARGLSDGKVIFGSNFTLAKGETLDGDLVVFGGNVTIEADAKVNGSLVVFGGNASVATGAKIDGDVAMIGGNMSMDGSVNGDMVMVGGQAALGPNSLVDGNLSTIGGQLQRDPGSRVTGEIVNNVPAPSTEIPSPPAVPNPPKVTTPNIKINLNPLWGVGNIFFQAFALALVAMLASLFLQPQIERVSSTIKSQPVIAGGFGLLTLVVAPLALVIVALTIILLPVSFLAAMGLVLAWLFGMIAVGNEVGERFTNMIHQTWAPALTIGFGTFLLMLAVGVVGLVPCVGWLGWFVIGLMAFGGVIMTLLGNRVQLRPAAIPPADIPPAS